MAVKKNPKQKIKRSNCFQVKTNHDTAAGSNMTTLPGTHARRGSPLGTLWRIPDLPGSPAAGKRLRQLRSCVGDLGRADIMQKLRAMSAGLVCLVHPDNRCCEEDPALARCPARCYQQRPCHSGSAVIRCPKGCWIPGSPCPLEFSQSHLLSTLRTRGSIREEMDLPGATSPQLHLLCPHPTPSFLLPPGLPEHAPEL